MLFKQDADDDLLVAAFPSRPGKILSLFCNIPHENSCISKQNIFQGPFKKLDLNNLLFKQDADDELSFALCTFLSGPKC